MPKRYLAWDTSRATGILCAIEEGPGLHLRRSSILSVDQRQHSEGLFVGIDHALADCGWHWGDLSAIGIGIGPGSFTGVRVGLTAARTFGQMLGLPLVPVSSLAVATRWARTRAGAAAGAAIELMACLEACMGEVYCRHEPARGTAVERVIKLSELEAWTAGLGLEQAASGSLVVCSDKLSRHPSIRTALIERGLGWCEDSVMTRDGEAWGMALAQELLADQAGVRALPALEVHPSYLRAPDAELKLRQRLGI